MSNEQRLQTLKICTFFVSHAYRPNPMFAIANAHAHTLHVMIMC